MTDVHLDPSVRRGLAALPLLALLTAARPAAADDGKPIEITVAPRGQPYSIGRYSGGSCEPFCKLHIPPDKYLVTIGAVKEEMLLDGPAEITYSPGSPRLRTVGGWMAIGGIGGGAVFLAIGIYGYAESCHDNGGCTGGLHLSNTAKLVLVSSAAALISISVTGAIMYAVSGESITARDLPRRAAAAQPSFDVRLNPSIYGGTLDFVKRF